MTSFEKNPALRAKMRAAIRADVSTSISTLNRNNVIPQDRQNCADIAEGLTGAAPWLRTSSDPQPLPQESAVSGNAPVTNVEGYTRQVQGQPDPHHRRAKVEGV